MIFSKFSPKYIYEELLTTKYPIPFYDAFKLTSTKETVGIGMLLFSTVYNRSEVYFGILIGLEKDYELRQCAKKYVKIIEENELAALINTDYPNWKINYVLTHVLINKNIITRSKYINFKTSYSFKTPSFKDFRTGYTNVIADYKKSESVTLIGYPDVDGIKSSLLFIDNTIIKYHNNKPIGLSDPYGLAEHVEKHEAALKTWAKRIAYEHAISQPLVVDFIWCGGDIRPHGSLANVEKMMIVYFIGYYNKEFKKAVWKQPVFSITDKNSKIYDIRLIKQYRFIASLENDKNNESIFNTFTQTVEFNCPVADYFGKPNKCGYGVIWHVEFNDRLKYFFLIKGSGHNTISVDNNKRLDTFVAYVLTKNRLEQAAVRVGEIMPKNLPTFITELYSNILETEQTYIKSNAFNLDDLEKEIWSKGARWFRGKYLETDGS